jgi:hypothetical protein
MQRDLPELLRKLYMLLSECRYEEAEQFVIQHFGRRKKKKKHKAIEGQHGDGI